MRMPDGFKQWAAEKYKTNRRVTSFVLFAYELCDFLCHFHIKTMTLTSKTTFTVLIVSQILCFLSFVSQQFCKSILRTIRWTLSNAVGWDNSSMVLIRKVLFAILPVLTHISNACFVAGSFPEKWKSSHVRRLNKVGNSSSSSRLQAHQHSSHFILECGENHLISDCLLTRYILNPFHFEFLYLHRTWT